MTLAFPLSLTAFWDQLPISTLAFDCPPQVETSGTGGGQILSREIAPRLWRGTLTLGKLTPAEAGDILPLIELAAGAGASFLAHDLMRPYPSADPDGSRLGVSAVSVHTIGVTRRDLRLSGLPSYYLITRGDLIGLSWGGGPVRYGLHRVVVPASADATGLTGSLEVSPPIHSAVTVGGPATLARPPIKAVIVPGSVQPGTLRRGLVEGIGLSFTQSMR